MTATAADTVVSGGEPPLPVPARHSGPARHRLLTATVVTMLVAAVALWSWSVATAQVSDLGPYGLLPALAWPFYAALGLATAAALLPLCTRSPNTGLMAAATAQLAVYLYGTTTVVESAPHLPWVYKHIGVTQYIGLHGSVNSSLDIYNRWPGFFSLAALLDRLTGDTNPVGYAAWFEPLCILAEVGFVLALARTIRRDPRWYWTATLIFLFANWVGQNYFSPQAFAFLLYLAMCTLTFTFLIAAPGRFGSGLERLFSRVLRARPADEGAPADPGRVFETGVFETGVFENGGATRVAAASTRSGRLLVVGLIVLLQVVISASHQLTPYIIVLTLAPVFALGYARPRALALALLVIPLAYLIPNYTYVAHNFGIFSSLDPAKNATYSTVDVASLPAPYQLQGRAVAALSLLVWGLALLGLLRRIRAGHVRSALVVGWLAFAPALTLAGQSYGGEGRQRVFLFSLTWSALAGAWCFWPGARRRERSSSRGLAVIPAALTVLVLAPVFVFTQFQPEADYQIAATDVSASAWLYAHAPPGSAVLLLDSQAPGDFTANYPVIRTGATIADAKVYFTGPLTLETVDAISRSLRPTPGANRYLLFTDIQDRYAVEHKIFTRSQLTSLYAGIMTDPQYHLVFRNATATVYRFGPDQAPAKPPTD